jgi:hypothetical protein
MTLELVVRSYPPSPQEPDGHDVAQESTGNGRKKLAESVAVLVEAWNDRRSTYESRKRALHRAIRHGIQLS